MLAVRLPVCAIALLLLRACGVLAYISWRVWVEHLRPWSQGNYGPWVVDD